MNSPKVSVIVPVYNVEQYLSCCVDSLLNQTLRELEIILVDDGSPDNCPALCDEYAKKDQRVKVIHKKNAGLGYARNSGIEIATGEYITFVDSDDYVELNTYQKLYAIATDTNVDVVFFSYQHFNDQGKKWTEPTIHQKIRHYKGEEIRGIMLDIISNPPKAKNDSDFHVSVWSKLYRYEIIKSNGLKFKSERELISEDRLFNLDYLLHSSGVITIPDTLYQHRMNVSSLSRTVRTDRITKNHFYYQYMLELLRKNNFGMEGFLRATRLYIADSRYAIRQYVQSPLSKREKIRWLQEVTNHPVWREIASSYPYWHLPLKYAIHFYFSYKGYCRLLYYYSKLN